MACSESLAERRKTDFQPVGSHLASIALPEPGGPMSMIADAPR